MLLVQQWECTGLCNKWITAIHALAWRKIINKPPLSLSLLPLAGALPTMLINPNSNDHSRVILEKQPSLQWFHWIKVGIPSDQLWASRMIVMSYKESEACREHFPQWQQSWWASQWNLITFDVLLSFWNGEHFPFWRRTKEERYSPIKKEKCDLRLFAVVQYASVGLRAVAQSTFTNKREAWSVNI